MSLNIRVSKSLNKHDAKISCNKVVAMEAMWATMLCGLGMQQCTNSLHPWCIAVWVCNNTQCTMQQFRRQPFLNNYRTVYLLAEMPPLEVQNAGDFGGLKLLLCWPLKGSHCLASYHLCCLIITCMLTGSYPIQSEHCLCCIVLQQRRNQKQPNTKVLGWLQKILPSNSDHRINLILIINIQ